jgi:hypothetical protein
MHLFSVHCHPVTILNRRFSLFQLVQRSLVELEGVEPLLETCSHRFIRESDLTACLAASLHHLPTREQRRAFGISVQK